MKLKNGAKHALTLTAAGAVICASISVGAPANAASLQSSGEAVPEATWTALDDAISKTGVFDGAAAASAGASSELINDFATGWAATGGTVTHASVDESMLNVAEAATPRACVGRNSLDYTGIQLNAYLNSCNSSRVLGMVNQGAGVGVIAAAVTSWTGVGGVAAGAIAGALAISSGLITTCTAKGRGMAAHMIPPTAVMWCNNQ